MTKKILAIWLSAFLLFMGLALLDQREAFLSALTGQSSGLTKTKETEEKKNIKDNILKFNKIYSYFYDVNYRGDDQPLRDFPGAWPLKRAIFMDINYLKGRNLLMVIELTETSFRKIELMGPYDALVVTRENWNFAYYKYDTFERISKPQIYGIVVEYRLHKDDKGQWIVYRYVVKGKTRPDERNDGEIVVQHGGFKEISPGDK